ncbi:MAG TPA: M23 family metallopeptidase [Chitinophagaceae bacterium]|jgi:hypothetical protein|nr:M23 family metallopeptidase [Chitinophagaceae bacterium]
MKSAGNFFLQFFIRYSLFVCSIFSSGCSDNAKKQSTTPADDPSSNKASFPLPNPSSLNKFVASVRDGSIDTTIAIDSLEKSLAAIKAYSIDQSLSLAPFDDWKFPLQGYSITESIAEKDKGYIPGRYSFFQGNEHKGHPALDIFIRDTDQDMIDDRTGKEVSVLSVSSGIVIAVQPQWDTTSALRGGRYIWVYDPANDYLLYYAHNNRLLVTPGQWLQLGDVIATVGRSGANAYKERSPTHLHFMLLKLDSNYYPRPVNPFPYLK